MLPGPPSGRHPAWGAHFHCCATYVNGLCGGVCGFVFIVKPTHRALTPRRCLSQSLQARTGKSDLGGTKPLPPQGSFEEPSSPPSALWELFQGTGWETVRHRGVPSPPQGYPKGIAIFPHPLLPTHCCSLAGGHRLPSMLLLHCF